MGRSGAERANVFQQEGRGFLGKLKAADHVLAPLVGDGREVGDPALQVFELANGQVELGTDHGGDRQHLERCRRQLLQPSSDHGAHAISEKGTHVLGAQAGTQQLNQVFEKAGFRHFRQAAQTPFNLVFEARP